MPLLAHPPTQSMRFEETLRVRCLLGSLLSAVDTTVIVWYKANRVLFKRTLQASSLPVRRLGLFVI